MAEYGRNTRKTAGRFCLMVGDCGTNMAMAARQSRKPIDASRLDELALSYVSKYATSRAKLKSYLGRKLREQGWAGDGDPPIDALADRMARLGYVDDRAYAMAKARSLSARGFGSGRVRQALAHAGIDEEDSGHAREFANSEAYESALRFARRKSLGPYAPDRPDARGRERAIAAMIRAGHGFSIAREIIDLGPGEFPDCAGPSNPPL
jgi:regulatory protein